MTRLRTLLIVLLTAIFPASSALSASPDFVPIPGATAKAKASKLKLRVVGYTGSTNGEMIVEVLNDSRSAEDFNPAGLYFVPKGDPEVAPQRLGATGPFEIADGEGWKDAKGLKLGAGKSQKVKLQVFCIDSHRPSPSTATPFGLAGDRMPQELRAEVETGTQAILKANKVGNAKHVKGEVQSHMWKTRDKKWIKLHGERKKEKAGSQRQMFENAPQQMDNRNQQRRK